LKAWRYQRTIAGWLMWGWLAMLVAGAAVFAACGSPDDGEDVFTFDPQPYITRGSGTPIPRWAARSIQGYEMSATPVVYIDAASRPTSRYEEYGGTEALTA